MLPTLGDRIQDSVNPAKNGSKSSDGSRTKAVGTEGLAGKSGSATRVKNQFSDAVAGAAFRESKRTSMSGKVKNEWISATLALPNPGRPFALWIVIPAIIAFAISVYLAVTSLTSSNVAGCSGEMFDCTSVLHSRWARWFGIPVSLLASVTYIGLLSSLALTQTGTKERRNLMWMVVTACSFSAGAAALWFTYLQFFVLDHLCQYCLAAHACGIVLAVSILIKNPLGSTTNVRMGILALSGLAIITIGQTFGTPPVTYTIQEFPSAPAGVHSINESDSMAAGFYSEGETEADNSIFNAPGDAAPVDDSIFEAPGVFEAPVIDPEPTESTLIETSSKRTRIGLPSAWRFGFHSLTAVLVVQQPAAQQPATQQPSATDANQAEKVAADKKSNETKTENKDDGPAEPTPPVVPTRRLAEIFGGNIKLDVNQWPLVGSPDAKYVFVEMFDYSCPHCRKTHSSAIKGAQQQMGADLAVLALPLPLNTNCNNAINQTGALFGESCEIAKLAVAVWRVDRAKFTEFHNWMFAGAVAPNYAAAKQHAEQLVDPAKLNAELNSTVPAAYIGKHVEIYRKIGSGNVPKLMFPRSNIVGEFASPEALVDLIKQHCLIGDSK